MTDEEAAERLDSLLDVMVRANSVAFDKEDAEALRAAIAALRHNSERKAEEAL